MNYILLNPSFQTNPIEITNPEVVKYIEAYRLSHSIIAGDIIKTCVNKMLFTLRIKKIDSKKIYFELKPNRYY